MSFRTVTGLLALSLMLPVAAAAQTGTIRYERSVTRDLTQAAAMLRGPGGGGAGAAAGRGGGDGPARGGADAPARQRPDNLPTIQAYSELTVTFDGTAVMTQISPAEVAGPGARGGAAGARRQLGGGDRVASDGALAQRISQAMPRREDHSVWVDPMSGQFVRGSTFLTREFRIEGQVPTFRWRFLGEESEYLGYVVQKAEAEHEGSTIEAWFTVEIPGFVAPDIYTGLPGVVLMVSVDRGATLIQAVEVDLDTAVEAIAPPTGGESISPEDFQALIEEKTEEFRQQMQGRLRRIGGGG